MFHSYKREECAIIVSIMNVLIFTDTYYPETNGVAMSTKLLVDTLKAKGHQVMVVTSVTSNKQPFKEGSVINITYPEKGNRGYIATRNIYTLTMFKHVRAFKPEVIHVETNGQIGQLGRYTSELLDIPFVYTYHTYHEKYVMYVKSGLMSRITRATERRYFQKMTKISTEIIAPSTKVKNYLRKKGVDKYINVIPTGINPKWLEEDDAEKKDIKYLHKKFELEDDTKIVLYVGRLIKEKSIDSLLQSFRKYLDLYQDDVRLILVGDGEQADELKELVDQLDLSNNVIFAGKVNHEKIKSYYLMADAFVSASLSETQSMAILESMACSTLVLARDDNLLSNLIDDEVNGFIYVDDEQFISKLHKMLTMDEPELEKMKVAAKKKVISDYNVDKYAEKVLEVYNRAQRKNW